MTLLFSIIKSEDTILERKRIELYREYASEPEEAEENVEQMYTPNLVEAEVQRIYEEAVQRANQSASRILEGAYAKRDKIVNTAEEDAKRVHQRARSEGYQEGLLEAASQIESQIKEMTGSLNDIRRIQQQNTDALSRDIIELSLSAAEKILHKRIEEDEEEMRELAHAAILSVKEKKQINLQISNQMIGLIDKLDKELEPVRERYQSIIKVKAVPMEKGTCRVETEDGIIDASVFVQLENLREQILLLADEK